MSERGGVSRGRALITLSFKGESLWVVPLCWIQVQYNNGKKRIRRTHSVTCEVAAAKGCSLYACEKTGGVGLDCGDALVACLRKKKEKKKKKRNQTSLNQ